MKGLPFLIALALVMAGCAAPSEPPAPSTGTLTGLVEYGDVPAAGIQIDLAAGSHRASTQTGPDGTFQFLDVPNGPCDVMVVTETEDHLIQTNCPRHLMIQLGARLSEEDAPAMTPAPTGPRTPQDPDRFLVQATVLDADGRPLTDVDWWAIQNEQRIGEGTTDAFGGFLLEAAAGSMDVHLASVCIQEQTFPLTVSQDLTTLLRPDLEAPPAQAPPTPTATPGLQGTVILTWPPVEGARGYDVTDGSQTIFTGGNAWMDHTPSGPYQIRAHGACHNDTEWSDPVDATPGPLPEHPSLLAESSASPEISTRHFAVLGLDGEPIGTIPWRVVEGTGNCCENFVATTRDGTILDFGGNTLFASQDDGVTWKEYTNHQVQVCGEGAVTPAHGGDIVAMNWEFCLGAGTDGVWSMKYIAADDQWVEGSQPIHTPFFDRPWMSVANGPFQGPDGETTAMVSYIYTNIHDNLHGTGHGISYDGVTYLPDSDLLAAPQAYAVPVPMTLPYDADADWIQPQVETHGRALAPGLHASDFGLTACQVTDTPLGRGCLGMDLPLRSMQRDSEGRLHSVMFDDNARLIRYRTSDDVGRTWDETTAPYIPQMINNGGEWDLKAHASLDRAMVAMHADVQGGTALDLVYVFRDISSTPTLDRILQVGAGGGSGDSGVAASDARYDFMSTGFLPDGRIVLSFRDAEVTNPALAIGLTV